MKVNLHRLRVLAIECNTIIAQKAFGTRTDMSLHVLGLSAKKKIQESIGDKLDFIAKEQEAVFARIRKNFEGVEETDEVNAEYRAMVEQDQEFKDLNIERLNLWAEVVDFGFTAIPVTITDDISSKFKEDIVRIDDYQFGHNINPYMSFFGLLQEGFITEA